MMTKIKDISIIFTMFFVFSSCENRELFNNQILIFENFDDNRLYLLADFPLVDIEVDLTDGTLIGLEKIKHPCLEYEITGNLFDFLCRLEVINLYAKNDASNPSFNYGRLYYYGEIELLENCKSYLIMQAEEAPYQIIRYLYMLNVDFDKRLRSITKVSGYTCFNAAGNYTYTKVQDNNLFVLKDETVSSDVILPDGTYPKGRWTTGLFFYEDI